MASNITRNPSFLTRPLEVRGPTGTGAASAGVLTLSTEETSVRVSSVDQLGRIDFQAPKEGGGTDAILVGASIYAECEEDFASDNNSTALVFATGTTTAPVEHLRLDQDGLLKLSYDATKYLDVKVLSDGGTDITASSSIDITGSGIDLCSSSAGIDLNSATSIELDTSSGLIYYSKDSFLSFLYQEMDMNNKYTTTYYSTTENYRIQVAADGVTTFTTVDPDGEVGHLTLAPDGDTIIDRNTALTATGTAKGLHIDYDHTDISASGQTVTGIGLDLDMNCETVTHVGTVNQTGIDLDMVAATDGVQRNVCIDVKCSGGDEATGLTIDTDGGTKSTGIYIDNKNGTTDFQNVSSADATDYFTINTIAAGATTLSTVDTTVGATADLTLDVDGDIILDAAGGNVNILQAGLAIPTDKKVYFSDAGQYLSSDGTNLNISSGQDLNIIPTRNAEFQCAAGFLPYSEAYGQAGETGEGGSATDLDFRVTNKIYLEATGDIAQLSCIFPNVAGNFVFLLKHGVAGGCDIAAYSAYYSDVSHESTIRWPSGTAPTLSNTEDEYDIISFYWPGETLVQAGAGCFAVASVGFSAP